MKIRSTLLLLLCSGLMMSTLFAQKAPKISLGHSGMVKDIYSVEEGKYYLTLGQKRAILWDAKTGKELKDLFTLPETETTHMIYFSFDKESNTLVSVYGIGGAVPTKWKVYSKQLFTQQPPKKHVINSSELGQYASTITDVHILPGGVKALLVVSGGPALFDLRNGSKQSLNLDKDITVGKVAIHPNGKQVAILYNKLEVKGSKADYHQKIGIIDLEKNKLIQQNELTTFKAEKYADYMYANLEYSFFGDEIVAGFGKEVAVLNSSNLKIVGKVLNIPSSALGVALSKDGKYVAVGMGNILAMDKTEMSGAMVFDKLSAQKVNEFMGSKYPVSFVAFSSDGTDLLVSDYSGNIKQWDIQSGFLTKSFSGEGGTPGTGYTLMLPNGRTAISSVTNGIIHWEVATSRMLNYYPVNEGNIVSMDVDHQGEKLVVGCQNGVILLYDVNNGTLLKEMGEKVAANTPELERYKYMVQGIQFIPNSTKIAYLQRQNLHVYDYSTNRRVLTEETISTSFGVDEMGRRLIISSGDILNQRINVFNPQNGSKKHTFNLGLSSVFSMKYIDNDQAFIVSAMTKEAKFGAYIYDASNGSLKRDLSTISGNTFVRFNNHPSGNGVFMSAFTGEDLKWIDNTGNVIQSFSKNLSGSYDINLTNDGKFMVSSGSDKTTKFIDAQSGELLFTKVFFSGAEQQNWVAYTPDGRFDGTEEGIKNLYFLDDLTIIPLESMFEKFYTPNLTARLLEGEQMQEVIQDIDELANPPLVSITIPQHGFTTDNAQVSISVSAQDQGGGVDEIRLYLNGKLIGTDVRGFKSLGNSQTFNISLSEKVNRLKAVALNNQRTESIPDELTIIYEGVQTTPDLHLLVIGANQYRNPKYNLNYAAADAQAFKATIESRSQHIFNQVNITEISDAGFTREKLFQAFEQIKAQASGDDVFIFYYAGHGVMSEETQSQFYIIPHDVTQLYGNNDMLSTNAVSAKELQQFSTELQAQKQLFILDACQSGGMTELLASRGAAEEKAIAQLARSTGTYWLTASGSEQFATEFAQLGHGVFTYAILNGLQGAADGGAKDKKITVKELSAFLNDRVPELSEQYKGQMQFPTSYGFGQDFPVVVID